MSSPANAKHKRNGQRNGKKREGEEGGEGRRRRRWGRAAETGSKRWVRGVEVEAVVVAVVAFAVAVNQNGPSDRPQWLRSL